MMTPDEIRRGVFCPNENLGKIRVHEPSFNDGSVRRMLEVFVKIVIVSDIHANLAALEALPEQNYSQLWCVGDLVDYGPKPHEVIQWIKYRATVAVRGNHDHAVGFSVDPQCSFHFKALAAKTQRYTEGICTEEDVEFLRGLPTQQKIAVNSTRFYLVHAMPTDPLFGYCSEQSERWKREIERIDADVLVVGHTHMPFIRIIGKTIIINPGSLGQPKTGRPLACYALWEDGRVSLKEYEYPLWKAIEQIHSMPISAEDQDALITVLQTGVLPDGPNMHSADGVKV
jgi:putative phosphoesterase